MPTNEEIEQEFDQLVQNFEAMKTSALNREGLVEILAKHPLYEIEPFYFEHWDECIDDESSLLVSSEEDLNPEEDTLFTHWVNVDMEQRKTHFRREHLGETIYYDTVFEYHDDYIKSATVFFSPKKIEPIRLDYLQLKGNIPQHYTKVRKHGLLNKEYRSEDGLLQGYFAYSDSNDGNVVVDFEYTPDSAALNSIVLTNKSSNKQIIIYQRPKKGQNIANVLAQLEENMVEEITQQIQEKVRINEKVYCILLQYGSQGPFPPAVAIGLESEYDEEYMIGAADMHYYSEDDTLPIDLYTPEIEEAEVFVRQNRDMMKLSEDEFDRWMDKVEALYLRVCKRLYHMDFSMSFHKTDHFLVYASDLDVWNDEEYIEKMRAYIVKNKN
ncbi:hypothetical protein OOZ15_18560 [Galbibacter sp. EGI 63066]|uniref:hypothetical protein n=1 Tax=Galbibacter sp. EGI 63066 TaxID=2993559 RepID=UPI00224954AA|nr:hypothetical protein [Galbibacter sp. EGI 63066]MCX2681960.1 hypothetical protein [Galbibacter sp. EGI 63066]